MSCLSLGVKVNDLSKKKKKEVGESPRNNTAKQILRLEHWDSCPVVPSLTYVYFSVGVALMILATSLFNFLSI